MFKCIGMLIGFFPLTNVAKSESSMFLTILLRRNIINKTSFFYLNQFLNTLFQATYHLNNYFRLHVCLSIRSCVTLNNFMSYFKMLILKVPLVCVRMKNVHFSSPSDPWGPSGKAKPSYVRRTLHY